MQRATRDERIAGTEMPPTYASVRAALVAARAEVIRVKTHPGQYHYAHATGDYDVAGGRTVRVALAPASDGGWLLGVHRYTVLNSRYLPGKWRAL